MAFARLLLPLLLLAGLVPAARAADQRGCMPAVASADAASAWRAALDQGEVGLRFLGHASFLIETPSGLRIITDYNGYNRAERVPDVVTMNNAHSTHYTNRPEPGIKLVLRGWSPDGGPVWHDERFEDVRIRNIPTNTREWGGQGTRTYGNSIFIFETGGLCIAHLSHLHHVLEPQDLADLGQVDVLIVPADGIYTLSQEDMITVIGQVKAPLVIPMHYMGPWALERFLPLLAETHQVRRADSDRVVLSRMTLPDRPELLILQGW